jgi:hypothetical protein
MDGDFFRLHALLRVASGPQGHAQADLAARLLHRTYASKKLNRINEHKPQEPSGCMALGSNHD